MGITELFLIGIGLSMAKAIVAQHKGMICARSQGGNTVILTVRL